MPHLRRLPLASVYNMRDLGGYAAAGGTTAFGRLWRADLLGALPDMDISAILAAGVRTVIDLRGPDECLRVPSSFLDVPGVRYVNVSLLGDTDQLSSRMGMPLHDSFLHSLSILYSTMLDCNGRRFVQVFEAIFEGLARGGVAFHCTAGKDRTGVIAAMALELCIKGQVGGVALADFHTRLLKQGTHRGAVGAHDHAAAVCHNGHGELAVNENVQQSAAVFGELHEVVGLRDKGAVLRDDQGVGAHGGNHIALLSQPKRCGFGLQSESQQDRYCHNGQRRRGKMPCALQKRMFVSQNHTSVSFNGKERAARGRVPGAFLGHICPQRGLFTTLYPLSVWKKRKVREGFVNLSVLIFQKNWETDKLGGNAASKRAAGQGKRERGAVLRPFLSKNINGGILRCARGVFGQCLRRLSLGELGRTAGCLEAVLQSSER